MLINNAVRAAVAAFFFFFITAYIITVISNNDHLRILVLQCRTQLAAGHEDFIGEQEVSHTGICTDRQTSQLSGY